MRPSRSTEASTHFPEQWSGNYLFYNKRLFAEAGVPPPPRTLGAAVELRRIPGRRHGSDQTRGIRAGHPMGFRQHLGLVLLGRACSRMNNGVPWATPRKNPTHLNFDDDAFIEAVQFYADLANKHKVAPNASEVQSMSTPDLFAAGKAAMALGGHWRYQTFIRADGLDFDVAPLPVGPRGRDSRPARISVPPDWPSRRAVDARSRRGNS